MIFLRPWMLLLLALPLILAIWEWRRRGHAIVLPFDHARPAPRPFLRRLITTLNLVPALLLAVAILLLAGPQRMMVPEAQRDQANILLTLDVSGSMKSPFGSGNRADAAIAAIEEFTTHRKGDAFGLTVFGSDVLHWVPVTQDLSAIRHSSPFLRPEHMPDYMGGTRIGRALKSVQQVMAARPEGDRMVILISDGESSDLKGGAAEEIGLSLASDRIVVYYIHVGSGSPQAETFSLTSTTGGEAFAAGDPDALHGVFRRIDALRPAKMKPGNPQATDHFHPFALAGLCLLGLHGLGLWGLRYTPW